MPGSGCVPSVKNSAGVQGMSTLPEAYHGIAMWPHFLHPHLSSGPYTCINGQWMSRSMTVTVRFGLQMYHGAPVTVSRVVRVSINRPCFFVCRASMSAHLPFSACPQSRFLTLPQHTIWSHMPSALLAAHPGPWLLHYLASITTQTGKPLLG
jgi:hypothetical protein